MAVDISQKLTKELKKAVDKAKVVIKKTAETKKKKEKK